MKCLKCGCCPAYPQLDLCIWCHDGLTCPGRKAKPHVGRIQRETTTILRQPRLFLCCPGLIQGSGSPAHPSPKPTFIGGRPRLLGTVLRKCATDGCPHKFHCKVQSSRRWCRECQVRHQQTAMAALGPPQRKWVFTVEMDARVRELYAIRVAKGGKKLVPSLKRKLSAEFKMPEHAIRKRANELGLSFTKEKPWTSGEIELLMQHTWKGNDTISRIFREHGLARSPTAINIAIKRKLGGRKGSKTHYSQMQVCNLLGVDHRLVRKWIDSGKLRAWTAGVKCAAGEKIVIWPAQLYDFIRENRHEFDVRKVDQSVFLDLIFDEQQRRQPAHMTGARNASRAAERPSAGEGKRNPSRDDRGNTVRRVGAR